MKKLFASLFALMILAGCNTMEGVGKDIKKGGEAIEKTLKAAEQDARTGNEQKAIQEINAAEKALIEEDKKKPYVQGYKSWTGEDAKAKADTDAIKELDHARKDAKGNLAGDAADEIKKAIKDVEVKEKN